MLKTDSKSLIGPKMADTGGFSPPRLPVPPGLLGPERADHEAEDGALWRLVECPATSGAAVHRRLATARRPLMRMADPARVNNRRKVGRVRRDGIRTARLERLGFGW
jgi:hypothetical protein